MPEMELPAGPSSPRLARAFVAAWLDEWSFPELQSDAAVVTSELATNAVVHTRQPFEISIGAEHGTVRISVSDRDHRLPDMEGPPEGLATSGRGLPIVKSLASSCGMRLIPDDGKQIWACFEPAG